MGTSLGRASGLHFKRKGMDMSGMNQKFHALLFGVVVLFSGCSPSATIRPSPAALNAAMGSVVELPPLAGDYASFALALNDSRPPTVVGYSQGLAGVRAVYWEFDDAGTVRVHPLPGVIELPQLTSSKAVDVNNSGTIVGWAREPDWHPIPMIWESRPLGYAGRNLFQGIPNLVGEAMGIDDMDLISGRTKNDGFVFKEDLGPPQVLPATSYIVGTRGKFGTGFVRPTPEGGGGALFNDQAVIFLPPVAGGLSTGTQVTDLEIGTEPVELDLSQLSPSDFEPASVHAVSGYSVLESANGESLSRAVLWEVRGIVSTETVPDVSNAEVTVNDLGLLPEMSSGYAMGLNVHRDVVGYAEGNDVQRAFHWSHEAGLQDLNTGLTQADAGWTLEQAWDINEPGEIVGNGLLSGQTRGFFLRAVAGPVVAVADVEVIKRGPDFVGPGQNLRYVVEVWNHEESPQEITAYDLIPTGTQFDQGLNPEWTADGSVVSQTVSLPGEDSANPCSDCASCPNCVELPLQLTVTATAGQSIENVEYGLRNAQGIELAEGAPVVTRVVVDLPDVTLLHGRSCSDETGTVDLSVVVVTTSPAGIVSVTLHVQGPNGEQTIALQAPYTYLASNLPPGTYSIWADVVDGNGTHVTSNPEDVALAAGDNRLPDHYLIEELPPYDGGRDSYAMDINEHDVIVGSTSATGTGQQPARWLGSTSAPFTTVEGRALSVNDDNHIVGEMRMGSQRQAFVWRGGGQVFPVTPSDVSRTTGMVINNLGQILVDFHNGWKLNDNGLWFDLQTSGYPTIDVGRFLNDEGVVTGTFVAPDGLRHAYRWDSRGGPTNQFLDLGPVGSNSYGMAINGPRQVIGMWSSTSDGEVCRWELDGSFTDLGNLGAFPGGISPLDINDQGVFVGTLGINPGQAFVGSCDELRMLKDLLEPASRAEWSLLVAGHGINESGKIVGWGIKSDGSRRGFVLTPVYDSQP